MTRFELCYEYNQEQSQYIIPDLLPRELEDEPELTDGSPLSFVMTYDYLPSSIISRMMLRYKNEIVNRQQLKYGMILESPAFGCRAKIKSDELNKEITIIIEGDPHRKREYFSAIRRDLSDISPPDRF